MAIKQQRYQKKTNTTPRQKKIPFRKLNNILASNVTTINRGIANILDASRSKKYEMFFKLLHTKIKNGSDYRAELEEINRLFKKDNIFVKDEYVTVNCISINDKAIYINYTNEYSLRGIINQTKRKTTVINKILIYHNAMGFRTARMNRINATKIIKIIKNDTLKKFTEYSYWY